jgi:hypothetical protein
MYLGFDQLKPNQLFHQNQKIFLDLVASGLPPLPNSNDSVTHIPVISKPSKLQTEKNSLSKGSLTASTMTKSTLTSKRNAPVQKEVYQENIHTFSPSAQFHDQTLETQNNQTSHAQQITAPNNEYTNYHSSSSLPALDIKPPKVNLYSRKKLGVDKANKIGNLQTSQSSINDSLSTQLMNNQLNSYQIQPQPAQPFQQQTQFDSSEEIMSLDPVLDYIQPSDQLYHYHNAQNDQLNSQPPNSQASFINILDDYEDDEIDGTK